MSMVLYALCLQPFLIFLNRKMAGMKIGYKMSPTAVVAYEDDVTIFVTHEAELAIVEEAINLFEKASGCTSKPTDIQRNCDLWMEYNSYNQWNRFLPIGHNTRGELLGHNKTENGRHLGKNNRESPQPG
jgi:hypothetical protein